MPDTAIELSPEWGEWEHRLLGSKVVVEEEMAEIAVMFAEDAKETAKHFLDVFVYDAPLPKSADNDPDYLEEARTERTRHAIKARVRLYEGGIAGEAYIDKDEFLASQTAAGKKNPYPYYLSLEFGLATKPAYYPRPFWRAMEADIRIRYRTYEEALLRRVVGRIGGKFR